MSANRNIELQAAMANMNRQVAVQIARKKNLDVPQAIVAEFDASIPVADTVDFFIRNARPFSKRQRRKAEARDSSGGSSNRGSRRHADSAGPSSATSDLRSQGIANNSLSAERARRAKRHRIRKVLLMSGVLFLGLVATSV